MLRRQPSSTGTDTLYPDTTLCRSQLAVVAEIELGQQDVAGPDCGEVVPHGADAAVAQVELHPLDLGEGIADGPGGRRRVVGGENVDGSGHGGMSGPCDQQQTGSKVGGLFPGFVQVVVPPRVSSASRCEAHRLSLISSDVSGARDRTSGGS